MIEREKLLRLLRNASELEEGHNQVIAWFFLHDFDWGEVPKEKVEKVKSMLRTIEKQTQGHDRMINYLMEYVRGAGKDGF